MRARQFLSLASPLMVERDGRKVVVLAFVVGSLGSLRAMTIEPLGGRVSFPTIESLTFPAVLAAGPVAGSLGGTLGRLPSRAERRAAARERMDA